MKIIDILRRLNEYDPETEVRFYLTPIDGLGTYKLHDAFLQWVREKDGSEHFDFLLEDCYDD